MKYTEYLKLKIENPEKIVLIKVGNFFHTFDIDALILESLLGYKLKIINEIEIGFPISIIDKVENVFNQKQINYMVGAENKIKIFEKNYYLEYKDNIYERYETIKKYKFIINELNNNIFSEYDNIENIDRIFKILKKEFI